MRTAIVGLVLVLGACSGGPAVQPEPYCDERDRVACPWGDGGRAALLCGDQVLTLAMCEGGTVPACDDDGTPFTCPVE